MAVLNNSKNERAVLYLRMSTDQQEQSISAQRDELHRYAKRQGYVIIDKYIDEAISGDNTQKRAGFLRMRDDTVSGRFSLVLCWDQLAVPEHALGADRRAARPPRRSRLRLLWRGLPGRG